MTTDQPDQPDVATSTSDAMDNSDIPLGQRLYDSPFLLLIACLVIMFGFFTGWGLLEIMSLEPAPLP